LSTTKLFRTPPFFATIFRSTAGIVPVDRAQVPLASQLPAANHNGRARMQHGLMYQGSFEKNYSGLEAGANAFRGTDDTEHQIPDWPDDVNGVKIGYMEKSGKKFYAVRVQFEGHDIILKNPVLLDTMRHLGNKRFAPEPTMITDTIAETLLDDLIERNPEQQEELALLINRVNQVRRASR
jgi:hypothetical protein